MRPIDPVDRTEIRENASAPRTFIHALVADGLKRASDPAYNRLRRAEMAEEARRRDQLYARAPQRPRTGRVADLAAYHHERGRIIRPSIDTLMARHRDRGAMIAHDDRLARLRAAVRD
jgi:hypothetical protein